MSPWGAHVNEQDPLECEINEHRLPRACKLESVRGRLIR